MKQLIFFCNGHLKISKILLFFFYLKYQFYKCTLVQWIHKKNKKNIPEYSIGMFVTFPLRTFFFLNYLYNAPLQTGIVS